MREDMHEVYKDRLARTRAMMRTYEVGGLFLTNKEENHGEHIEWLTGFRGSTSLCFVTQRRAVLVTDLRYEIRAPKEVYTPLWEIVLTRPPITYKNIYKTLRMGSLFSLGVLGTQLPADAFFDLQEKLARTTIVRLPSTLNGAFDALHLVQSVKSPPEIEMLRASARAIEEALEAVLPSVRVGINEEELDTLLKKELGNLPLSFPSIIGGGENSASIHHETTPRALRRGDIVQFDVGCVVDGYCSDISRIGVVGDPSPEQRRMYEAVKSAVTGSLALYRPGVLLRDADAEARRIVQEHGYDEFPHSLGHGIGANVHELPLVNKKLSENLLFEEGHVVTCEPGVYIPGVGGMRIERMVRITKDGHELLDSHLSDELFVFPES